jgi:sulfur-oxidizing protein SoxY
MSLAPSPTRGLSRRGLLARIAGCLALPWLCGVERAARPQRAFAAEEVATVLRELYGRDSIAESDLVRIGVAKLAENGAVVPVKVDVDLPHVDEITLVAARNPVPLVGRFTFGPRTRPFVATRVKLAETGEILAIARRGEELLLARATVEVTVGGCG